MPRFQLCFLFTSIMLIVLLLACSPEETNSSGGWLSFELHWRAPAENAASRRTQAPVEVTHLQISVMTEGSGLLKGNDGKSLDKRFAIGLEGQVLN